MDLYLREEAGKDKRLLVLLAFGILMLLVRAPDLLPDRKPPSRSWAWREGENGTPLRVVIDGEHPSDRLLSPDSPEPSLSPRLAFLLGRPLAVNLATADELALLEGIGPKLAENIVAHRQRHGPIDDPAEFREIPGIGKMLTERLAPRLSFD